MKKSKLLWTCILGILFIVNIALGWFVASYYLPRFAPSDDHLISADKIVVEKSVRKMTLYSKDKAVATYNIALGFTPEGHKQQKGDGRTPEGTYEIAFKNKNSKYHLSLAISYPSRQDILNARKKQLNPGGDIVIHGYPNILPDWIADKTLKNKDWTKGCIAVSNSEIEQIWSYVKVGTVIEIKP